MIDDRELWACAAHVLETHGNDANAFIVSRIETLARAGDTAGIATWRMIADRIDALRDVEGAGQARH